MKGNRLPHIFVLLFALAPAGSYGQFPADGEFVPGALDEAPEYASIETQPELFLRPLPGNAGLFSSFTRYNTSAMRYSRRGYDARWSLQSVAGLDVSSLARRTPDYDILSAATSVALQRPDELWSSPQGASCPGGEYSYDISPSSRSSYNRVALYAANRGYRWGGRFDKVWHGRDEVVSELNCFVTLRVPMLTHALVRSARPSSQPTPSQEPSGLLEWPRREGGRRSQPSHLGPDTTSSVNALADGETIVPRWSYQLAADRRWGRDPRVGGVFADQGSLLFAAERRGARSALKVMAIGNVGERGLRAYSTAEAFALRGDNLYNPSWGYYYGKVRNSSVARGWSGLLSMQYSKRLGGATSLEVTAGYMPRSSGRSRLEWYNAPDPRPDYYRHMPSWLGSGEAGDQARDMWLRGDATVTQIDWDGICARNLDAASVAAGGGGADAPGPYLLGEAVERSDNFQLAARFATRLSPRTTLHYGWNAAFERQQNYERVKDMLGAEPFADVDGFLIDDQLYGDQTLNDLNDPDRMVRAGGRFGYSYDMDLAQSAVFGSAEYAAPNFALQGSVQGGAHAFSRVGRFRKQIFADKGSYGRSQWFAFAPVAGSLRASYFLSPTNSFVATLDAGQQAPLPADIFFDPDHLDDALGAGAVGYAGAAFDYRLVTGPLRLNLSLFHTSTWGGTRTCRYWDDMLATYCNMGLSGVAMSNSGAEAAGDVALSRFVTLRGAVALGRYIFASDPRVTVVDDNSRERLSADRARLGGEHPGGAPSTLVSAGVDVRLRWGFMGSLTVNYMDGSYVDPSPLRRTTRAIAAAADPGAMAAQERLPAATTVNLTLYKSMRTRVGTLDLFAEVNNLLAERGIIYNGYEQMRLSRQRDGSFAPFPSRYLYSCPLTFYLRAAYRF